MKLKGIDVSEHQGNINWELVKEQIDYAILRIGYGDNYTSQDDKYFKRNADECTRLGIPFGVYIYSYAMSIEQAISEAEHVLRCIKGYKLSYPVYLDLEDYNTTGKCSKTLIADMAEKFANIIEEAGHWCGIYANTYWFTNILTDNRFSKWVKWVAQYASSCTYAGEHGMWQYASDGEITGISGNVDINYCYVDYESLINREEYDMEKVVLYSGDIDACSSILVSQKLRCPMMKADDFESSGLKAKEIIKIGGKPCDTNRYVSAKNAADLL